MPFCPTCGAAYRTRLPECPTCHVELSDTPDEATVPSAQPAWITVYSGHGVQLRQVEEGLRQQGFVVARLHVEAEPFNPVPPHRGSDAAYYRLTIPEDQYLARQQEVHTLVAAAGGMEEDPDAVREAEEDYDVRACPQCLLYFHENYSACPGCEAELVPAVECFVDGQAEPDRVIVGHGTEAAVKELAARLQTDGFDAQAFEVEGWTVDVVDLPWGELTDRTAEIETVLGIRPPGDLRGTI